MRRKLYAKRKGVANAVIGLDGQQLAGNETSNQLFVEEARISQAVSELPAQDQQILDYMVIHGLSREATGKLLEITVHTVRTRFAKAKYALAEALPEYDPNV